MIALLAIAALAIAYRIKTRRLTRAEGILLAVFAIVYVTIALQMAICDHKAYADMRYWGQGGTVLLGYAAWGLLELGKAWSGKSGLAKCLMPAVTGLFAVYLLVMVFKAQIPGSRRHANMAACDYAVERIRADWQGPTADETGIFKIGEYHQPNRPVVRAHTARVAYLLGGRKESVRHFGAADLPDYIFEDRRKLKFDDLVRAQDYQLIEEPEFEGRRFAFYRRIGRDGQ